MKLESKWDGPVMEWAWVSDALRERAMSHVDAAIFRLRWRAQNEGAPSSVAGTWHDDAIALEALIAYGRAARRPEPEAPRTYDAAPSGGDRYRREDVIYIITSWAIGGFGLTSKNGPFLVATHAELAAPPWERLHTKADAIYHCRHCGARMPTAGACPGRLTTTAPLLAPAGEGER